MEYTKVCFSLSCTKRIICRQQTKYLCGHGRLGHPKKRDYLNAALQKQGFPGDAVIKNPSTNVGDVGSVHGQGRSSGEVNGNTSSILVWRISSHGQRSLVGYSPCGCKELDMTEQLSTAHFKNNINKNLPVLLLLRSGKRVETDIQKILKTCI